MQTANSARQKQNAFETMFSGIGAIFPIIRRRRNIPNSSFPGSRRYIPGRSSHARCHLQAVPAVPWVTRTFSGQPARAVRSPIDPRPNFPTDRDASGYQVPPLRPDRQRFAHQCKPLHREILPKIFRRTCRHARPLAQKRGGTVRRQARGFDVRPWGAESSAESRARVSTGAAGSHLDGFLSG